MYKLMCIFVLIFIVQVLTINAEVEGSQYNELLKGYSLKKVVHYQPEQVHLSFGETTSDIVVTWNTRDDTAESLVEFGRGKFEFSQKASEKPYKFIDGGPAKSIQYIHRVTLPNLEPDTRYIYHCGSNLGWSAQFWFYTPPKNTTDWVTSIAFYGDMGNDNARSLPRLQLDTQNQMYDAIFHVGDFAYDMHNVNGEVGDEFMRQIETIAAYVPYMTCVGNHEQAYNFSHYRARFSMPGDTEGLFYSFDLGPIHFIGFSTEFYYYFNHYRLKHVVYQYEWLERDLQEANKPENRAKRPWIITFGHRPMYCSNSNGDDCTKHSSAVRSGLPVIGGFGLEDLFYQYGVDIEIWAHEHCYERLWPIHDFTVYNGSYNEPYRNPLAPVHIITGAAGNIEGREPFTKEKPEWSAFRSRDFGYTRMKAYNETHLYFEQISVDQEGNVIDSFWVIKDYHGAYAENMYMYS